MNVVNKIKFCLSVVRSFFPSALPVGMTEFDVWSNSIINTFSLPTKDEDSIKYALATMIMHLGPTVAYKSKFYFVLALRAAGAKQIAGGVFQQIKERQKAAQAAASAQQGAADGPKQ